MDVRLLLDPGLSGRLDHVLLTAAGGTRFADVEPLLRPHVGGSAPMTVDGRPVPARARVGLPPLVDGALVRAGPEAPVAAARPGPGDTGLELHVVAGPDAGGVHPLPPGACVLGRGPEADVRVADPAMSRRHLRVVLGPGGPRATDLGSTNGSLRHDDGGPRPLPREGGADLPIGALVAAGETLVALRPADDARARVRPRGDGTLALGRRPARTRPFRPARLTAPEAPTEPEAPRFGLVTLFLPLVVGVAVAVAFDNPFFLLFGLLSPVLTLSHGVSEGRRRRRRHRRLVAEHEDRLRRLAAALDRACHEEQAARRAAAPDPARVRAVATGLLAPLWERRGGDDGLLTLRLGRATVPALSTVAPTGGEARAPDLTGAAAAVRLGDVGCLGIAGPREAATALARCLLGQLATWASPVDVRLTLLTARIGHVEEWSWATLLPHARDVDAVPDDACRDADPARFSRRVDALVDLVRTRTAGPHAAGAPPRPVHVVLVDDAAALREHPGLARLLADGPEAGVLTVCLAESRRTLPVECRGVVDVAADGTAAADGPGDLAAARGLRCDLVSPDWALAVARALAPARDVAGDARATGPPEELDLPSILDVDVLDPTALARRWSARPRDTRVAVGATSTGVHEIDLTRDGPHVLVGGMTGSGKSEFLRTLVTSAALVNRPDALAFVLVDYKGGSAFDACAGLPHVLGVVTDLDGDETRRALLGLHAELRRREAALRRAGVASLEEHDRMRTRTPEGDGDGDGDGASLARLVIVIDEFRALVEEHPDFVHGLVRIAALGRSLGVHLVLATQRPAGVVSADIKANTNLRIALRVRDRPDSLDVIEAPDAADLSARRPGRALLRAGGGDLVPVQVARTGLPGRGGPPAPRLWVLDPVALVAGPPPAEATPSGPGCEASPAPDGVAAVVAAARRAAELVGARPSAPPWLPPLPAALDLDHLDEAGPAETGAIAYGLADDPERQRRIRVDLPLERGGHLAVVGGAGSGRTSLLRTLAGAVARSADPGRVHLHVVDGASGLADLALLPHTGTVVGPDDAPRLRRLLDHLRREVRAREGDREPGRPAVLVLVDGWERVRERLESLDHGRALEEWNDLLRHGPSVGVRVVVAGDRTLLGGTGGTLLPHRLLLASTDPAEALLAGLPRATATTGSADASPGRGRRSGDGLLVQVAVLPTPGPGVDAGPAAQRAALAAVAAASAARPDPGGPAPRRLAPLPPRVPSGSLPAADGSGAVPFALAADSLDVVTVDLSGDGLLVLGPRGSGRTNTLLLLAAAEPALLVVRPASRGPAGPTALPGARTVDPGDRAGLRAGLARDPGVLVVVDDLDLVADSPVEEELAALVREGAGVRILAAGTTRDVAERFRGLAPALRRRGRGLVLGARAEDRDVFGVPVPTGEEPTPGRGVLVVDGRPLVVQVAHAPAPAPGGGGPASSAAAPTR